MVRTFWGRIYFLTAGHVVDGFSATNGATGDTVIQSGVTYTGYAYALNQVGIILTNPAYNEGSSACGTGNDFCTNADVALGFYTTGISSARKVATSTHEGLNGGIGTPDINGFYPISGVLPAEMAVNAPYGIHKSGWMTGTTTGYIDTPSMDINVTLCWGITPPGTPCSAKQMRYLDVGLVRNMANVGGDSGGPIFAGNGNPYSALGILVGRGGPKNSDGSCQDVEYCFTFFVKWTNIESALGYGSLSPVT